PGARRIAARRFGPTPGSRARRIPAPQGTVKPPKPGTYDLARDRRVPSPACVLRGRRRPARRNDSPLGRVGLCAALARRLLPRRVPARRGIAHTPRFTPKAAFAPP